MPDGLLKFASRLKNGILSRCRNLYYRTVGVQIRDYAWLGSISIPREYDSISLSGGVALDDGVTLIVSKSVSKPEIKIEKNVYINRHTLIDASESVVICAETMIGPHCYITDHDHAHEVGQAPGAGELRSAPTKIGKRVWLGAHVTVLKGVEIGDDCIIGAGSVVTRSVPPRSIAVGIPAKVMRQR